MATLASPQPTPTRGGPLGLLARLSERTLRPSLILLVQRIGIGAVFFQSGRTKVEGLFNVPQTTFDLFETEYALPRRRRRRPGDRAAAAHIPSRTDRMWCGAFDMAPRPHSICSRRNQAGVR